MDDNLLLLFDESVIMNKAFMKIKKEELKELKHWLVKHYFNPDKNLNDIWFDFDVNCSNVLEYVSETKNNFPLTPIELLDMWKTIQSFKKSFGASEKEFDETYDNILKKEKTNKEYTLNEIGKQLGGITTTMINRLSKNAQEKFKTLTFDKHFHNMTDDELSIHSDAINNYRKRAIKKFTIKLKDSKGDIPAFLKTLVKEQILTEKEVHLIQPTEFDVLIQLASMPDNEVEVFLMNDIEKDHNIVKTYQSMVAHETFPRKKRGRPKKY